uniref:Uncharacterized protein n=1 Tax=Lactuca sativa TaxID=4236 RepID=A0A9R1VCI8_LACSA|nr:hypothetical protein LSAT_V11C500258000 [Lactuca sativa]
MDQSDSFSLLLVHYPIANHCSQHFAIVSLTFPPTIMPRETMPTMCMNTIPSLDLSLIKEGMSLANFFPFPNQQQHALFTPLFLSLQTTKKQQQQQHKKDGRRKRLIPSSSSNSTTVLRIFIENS